MKSNEKGFTLIELLIVIGIIAILAAGAMIAINPGQQFKSARDSNRLSHMNTIYTGLMAHTVDNQGDFADTCPRSYTVDCEDDTDYIDYDDECWTEVNDDNCGHLTNYIRSIPEDPQGGYYLVRYASASEQDLVLATDEDNISDEDTPVFGE